MRSSLQLSSATPIHKDELTKLITIWQSLQDHNDSIEFRNPVDFKCSPNIKKQWVYTITHSTSSILWI